LSVPRAMLPSMARHTTFKFCLDSTVEQAVMLSRHAGAARFAFNQCLRIVKTSLSARRTDPSITVAWTGFDLINTFNEWKKTEDAGRVFTVDTCGQAEPVVTGLAWRTQVCQQVFEEAAVLTWGKVCGLGRTADPGNVKASGSASLGSRRKPRRFRRFGCATSTPRAGRQRSVSATAAGRGCSHCPASAR
jgi:putative transposase